MKIRCNTRTLRESLALAASATSSAKNVGPTREVLARYHNGRLELHATDREVAIRVVQDAEVTGDLGEVLLPTKKLSSILAETSAEDIVLDVDEKSVEVRTGGSRFRLATESTNGFPPLKHNVSENGIKISSVLLRKIVMRTIFATDTDSTRYALGGVLFEVSGDTLTCAATDSRRLAICTTVVDVFGRGSSPMKGVVPTKVLRLLEKFPDCEISVSIDDNSVYFVSDRYEVSGRLVEGRFPRYRDVIPREHGCSVSMNVAKAMSAVRQSLIVTTDESRAAVFSVSNGRMEIRSEAADVGDSEIVFDVDSGDADVRVHLDPNYIAHFLKCVPPENVVLWRIVDADTAIVITDGDSYQYIVMPLSQER